MLDIKSEVLAAEARIRPYIRRTPLEYSFFLSEMSGANVYLKLENLQYTGSFKTRGAISRLLSLDPQERAAGVIAASTGNHGLAVAFGSSRLKTQCTIYLPQNASPQKVRMLRNYRAEVKFHGNDCEETEISARAEAEKAGQVYISPYNDPRVIGGQGTIAFELFEQLEQVDCIMASVGGGGLISGIAGYAKQLKKDIEIVGCLPKNSAAMYDAVKQGRIVESEMSPTISDGTAGGIEAGAITFEPCRRFVDDWVRVAEEEIQAGMKNIFEEHRYVIEGAPGVVVAAFQKIMPQLKGKNVILVMCGGNIEIEKFKQLVF
jgi:threonine dehydratase